MPPPLRIGSDAPDFQAETTAGPIKFHDYIQDSWSILFSHPQDCTPVCTTELGAFAKLEHEFTRRGVKLLGLSADGLADHKGWVKDIAEVTGGNVKFPITADPYRTVAAIYDMIDYQDPANIDRYKIPLTIRSVYFIDRMKRIRAVISYPASVGRNVTEMLRLIDSLQITDKHRVATLVDWIPGQEVIVAQDVKDDEARKLFPGFRTIKPYLRYTLI